MRRSLTYTVLACAALAAPAQAQLLTHRDLSYPLAKAIAEGAVAACAAKTYAVTAVVVDRDGEEIIMLRADGASPTTMENARRKAFTATSYHIATSEYAKRYASGNPVVQQQVTLPGIIAIPGGVPIKVGNDVVGAVGVSGSPGVDEDCVNAALTQVADQLK
jgi:uncharacterized protein GlcG (DUF336 family)